ncbi:MAG: hypothetical protein RL740_205 [Actinomycetota bacterium]|jgi:proteasome accessory factor B
MASEKNSRLINLVIALLATKKFLTKPQIFKAVLGYEGSADAADRMFERDKEELRALGIEIEMRSIDPLFEDEIGYRIRPEHYKFDLGPLNAEEIGILALAAEAWRNTAFQDIARSTSLRLESLGIAADFSEIPLISPYQETPNSLIDLLNAIENSNEIEMDYLNSEDVAETKKLAPHGIYTRSTKWYLFAKDLFDSTFKSYRLDRIDNEIRISKRKFQPEQISIPTEYFPKIDTILEIRRDHAVELQTKGMVLQDSDEFIKIRIVFDSIQIALSSILRHTPDVKVLEPEELVSAVKSALDNLVDLHAD